MGAQVKMSAVWVKKSKKGHEYFEGIPFKGAKSKVVVFPNLLKDEGSKQPDFRVYVEPLAQGDGHQPWQNQVAALWLQEDGSMNGRDALGVRVVLLPTAQKTKEKSPDATLYYTER